MSETSLTQDGGVVKVIVSSGKGECPRPKQTVKVYYEGRLHETGEVFDSSDGYPFAFRLGNNEVIKGWEIAVASMRVGEKARVTLRPEYAYGKDGAGDDIPPNAALVFDIELLSAEDVASTSTSAKDADLERLKKLQAEREEAAKKRKEELERKNAEKEAKAAQLKEKLAAKQKKSGKK